MMLETKRLILRPLTLADAETAFYGWTSDAENNKWVSWLPHHSLDDAIEWVKEIDWNQAATGDMPRDNYIWGFVLKETGGLFGSGGLIWEEDYQLYQVGYNINRSYWNKGYTTEAMKAVLDYAANILGLKRVAGGHAKENLASSKVLEKLGFVYDRDSITPHVDGVRQFDSREYYFDLIPKIRAMRESDYECLPEFLYQAIYIPEGEELPPRSVINDPEIFAYIKDFGTQPGDLGIVAEQNGQIVGAAWTRIIPAYGHVDGETPELAISILPEVRGYGIGTKLMKRLFDVLREIGYTQTSLTVQKDNPAVRFYQRLGYEMSGERVDHAGHEDYLMIKNLLRNEKEIEIVKKLTGVNDDNRIRVSEIGWTSRVYIVAGGKFVFKFPRTPKFRKACKQEVAVLELLKKYKWGVSIPIINWKTEDNAYFGFYGVEGKPLGEIIKTLNDEQKIDIGTRLGVFLKQLHNIKDYGNVTSQTLESQAAEYFEMYQRGRGLLGAFFDESELKTIDDFFMYEMPKSMTGSGELVFCHGDLDYNNTLINDKNQVGVIDFGDAGLYDRSQDFRGMDDVALREAMIKAYGGGEIISKEAAETTSKMIDVLNLIYCIGNRETEANEYIERIRMRFFDKGDARTWKSYYM